MKEEVKNWLHFASEDLKVAKLTLKEEIYNQVCFHSQQCAEKAIKALILSRGIVPPKIHKLADLTNYLNKKYFKKLIRGILSLDRYYIPTRYPDAAMGMLPSGLPTKNDAIEALNTAELVLRKAKQILKDKNES